MLTINLLLYVNCSITIHHFCKLKLDYIALLNFLLYKFSVMYIFYTNNSYLLLKKKGGYKTAYKSRLVNMENFQN